MKVSKNNKLINRTSISYCLDCAFFCKKTCVCLPIMVSCRAMCGGIYANEKLPEIFTL